MTGMNILMITTTLPHQMTNGGEIATNNLIEGMERCGHHVDVLGYTRLGGKPHTQNNFHSACDWVIETELAGWRKWGWLAQSFLSDLPYVCVKFRTGNLLRMARDLCARTVYDVVIIDHLQLGWMADARFLPGRKIGVAHNVEHQILTVQAEAPSNGAVKRVIFGRDARKMRAMESKMVADLDQIWTLTQEEKDSMAALGGEADFDIQVIPLPGQSFAPAAATTSVEHDVVILGSWVWDVNRRGLEWFVNEVAPLLPDDIKVAIGGKGTEWVPNKNPNVTYAGFVPDSATFLRSGRVICIPTVMGAGIQLKTIEGISIGRPVVTTVLGLRGIDAAPDYVATAVSAQDMADRLMEAIRAPETLDADVATAWARQRRDYFDRRINEALGVVMR